MEPSDEKQKAMESACSILEDHQFFLMTLETYDDNTKKYGKDYLEGIRISFVQGIQWARGGRPEKVIEETKFLEDTLRNQEKYPGDPDFPYQYVAGRIVGYKHVVHVFRNAGLIE